MGAIVFLCRHMAANVNICDISAFTTENKNPWITGSKVSQIQVQRLCREASPSADPADSWILL